MRKKPVLELEDQITTRDNFRGISISPDRTVKAKRSRVTKQIGEVVKRLNGPKKKAKPRKKGERRISSSKLETTIASENPGQNVDDSSSTPVETTTLANPDVATVKWAEDSADSSSTPVEKETFANPDVAGTIQWAEDGVEFLLLDETEDQDEIELDKDEAIEDAEVELLDPEANDSIPDREKTTPIINEAPSTESAVVINGTNTSGVAETTVDNEDSGVELPLNETTDSSPAEGAPETAPTNTILLVEETSSPADTETSGIDDTATPITNQATDTIVFTPEKTVAALDESVESNPSSIPFEMASIRRLVHSGVSRILVGIASLGLVVGAGAVGVSKYNRTDKGLDFVGQSSPMTSKSEPNAVAQNGAEVKSEIKTSTETAPELVIINSPLTPTAKAQQVIDALDAEGLLNANAMKNMLSPRAEQLFSDQAVLEKIVKDMNRAGLTLPQTIDGTYLSPLDETCYSGGDSGFAAGCAMALTYSLASPEEADAQNSLSADDFENQTSVTLHSSSSVKNTQIAQLNLTNLPTNAQMEMGHDSNADDAATSTLSMSDILTMQTAEKLEPEDLAAETFLELENENSVNVGKAFSEDPTLPAEPEALNTARKEADLIKPEALLASGWSPPAESNPNVFTDAELDFFEQKHSPIASEKNFNEEATTGAQSTPSQEKKSLFGSLKDSVSNTIGKTAASTKSWFKKLF